MYDLRNPPPASLPVLLKLAIDDLERIIAAGDPYTVDVAVWHHGEAATPYRPARCDVCLAGAVMAMRLAAPADAVVTPADFCPAWRRALEAIDALRCGEVDIAADIGDPVQYPADHIRRLINPEMSNIPNEWLAEWREVQFALERAADVADEVADD